MVNAQMVQTAAQIDIRPDINSCGEHVILGPYFNLTTVRD